MIRLIASDIDGTLIQQDAPISQRFFSQVRRLKEHGILFLAASGRQYDSLQTLFAPVRDEILYLCQNGAVVFYQDRLLFTSTLSMAQVAALTEEILAVPECEVLISYASGAYILPKHESYITLMREVKHSDVTVISSLDEITDPITKIAAYCPETGAAGMEPRFAHWNTAMKVAIGGPKWLDFALADKAMGLAPICTQLGISPEEVMAFGDNYNDVALLDLVGKPYIMASAVSPELRNKYPNCTSVEDTLDAFLKELEQ